MKRWAHEADPELYWVQYNNGEPMLRRKNRIGYVQRDSWDAPRMKPWLSPAVALLRFRDVILIDKVSAERSEDIVLETWLAYSLEFDEKVEGEDPPLYDYDAATGRWRRHD